MKSPKEIFTAFRASMLAKTDEWQHLVSEEITLKGPLAEIKGKAAFIEINIPFFNAVRGSRLYRLIESEGYIITQVATDVATPSGKTITLEVSEWYEIKDGLIQSLHVYFDTDEFRKEMMAS